MTAPENNTDSTQVEEAPKPTNKKNFMIGLPWTISKFQGDDEENSGFGFPTIVYPEVVEMTPEQYETAKVAARESRFRLREVY